MSDNITLPRQLVFRAVKALTPMAYETWPRERNEIVADLRAHLDAAADASTAPAMPCAFPHCCDKAGNRCPRMFAGQCSGPRAADPQQVGR